MKIKWGWLFLAGILLWGGFQIVVTPWGELPGKLIFNTNRIPLEKRYTSVMVRSGGENKTLQTVGYGYRWSPDGEKAAGFGEGLTLIDGSGKLIKKIPEGMIQRSSAWFPDGERLIVIEYKKSSAFSRATYEPTYLFTILRAGHERQFIQKTM